MAAFLYHHMVPQGVQSVGGDPYLPPPTQNYHYGTQKMRFRGVSNTPPPNQLC